MPVALFFLRRHVVFAVLPFVVCMLVHGLPVRANGLSLQTIPAPANILPFEAEAHFPTKPPRLTIKVDGQEGQFLSVQPLLDAYQPGRHLKIRMQLPAASRWLSTDFPMVEGKMLFSVDTPMPKSGAWSVEPMLPIRGDYSLTVGTTDNEGSVQNDQIKLSVHENPIKYWHFAILALTLLAVGAGGGFVIAGNQRMQPGQLAPTRVEILLGGTTVVAILALLFLAVAAEMNLQQHCQSGKSEVVKLPSTARDAKYNLAISGAEDAKVGDTASFKVQVTNTLGDKPAVGIPVRVNVTQLEENFPVLSFGGITDNRGQVTWQQTFFDGASHQIEASTGEEKSPILRVAQIVAVEAIHPPLWRRLITFGYMAGFLLIGLSAGMILKPLAGKIRSG